MLTCMLSYVGFPDDQSVWAKLSHAFQDEFRIVMACLPDYDKKAPSRHGGYTVEEVNPSTTVTFNLRINKLTKGVAEH